MNVQTASVIHTKSDTVAFRCGVDAPVAHNRMAVRGASCCCSALNHPVCSPAACVKSKSENRVRGMRMRSMIAWYRITLTRRCSSLGGGEVRGGAGRGLVPLHAHTHSDADAHTHTPELLHTITVGILQVIKEHGFPVGHWCVRSQTHITQLCNTRTRIGC